MHYKKIEKQNKNQKERVTWKHALPVRGRATVWGGGSIGVCWKGWAKVGAAESCRCCLVPPWKSEIGRQGERKQRNGQFSACFDSPQYRGWRLRRGTSIFFFPHHFVLHDFITGLVDEISFLPFLFSWLDLQVPSHYTRKLDQYRGVRRACIT